MGAMRAMRAMRAMGVMGIMNFELGTSCKLALAGGGESTGTSSKNNVHLYYE